MILYENDGSCRFMSQRMLQAFMCIYVALFLKEGGDKTRCWSNKDSVMNVKTICVKKSETNAGVLTISIFDS